MRAVAGAGRRAAEAAGDLADAPVAGAAAADAGDDQPSLLARALSVLVWRPMRAAMAGNGMPSARRRRASAHCSSVYLVFMGFSAWLRRGFGPPGGTENAKGRLAATPFLTHLSYDSVLLADQHDAVNGNIWR